MRVIVAWGLVTCLGTTSAWGQGDDWLAVGGDRGAMRYSTLDQIDTENVSQLEVAWTYHTGEPTGDRGRIIECTPVVVDGTLYLTTGALDVAALDAATGEEKWRFCPEEFQPRTQPLMSGGVNRGCSYWSDEKENGERRIFHGTADGRLFSLDARTGIPDPQFADGGVLDLRKHLEVDLDQMGYGPTSAPAIVLDRVVLGFSNGEGPGRAAPGDIRAFDVRTGEPAWRFHTVPREGEVGNDTWAGDSWKNRGGANAWGGFSVDVERGWVFAGLGSASFDFYGGDRVGMNLFANCTIALDARTGERVWHFQTLHHDLWDHDLPIYPNLVEVTRDGRKVEAAVQVTKTGYVFVFDRVTGEPLFEVREVPVPASDVPGEQAWPTQPVPVKPPPFCRTSMTLDDVTDRTPEAREAVLAQLEKIRFGPAHLPPSLEGSVCIPGFHGGATWSGASFDPTTETLFINSNNIPNVITLRKAPEGADYAYGVTGYHRFLDPDGFPAIKPPWGLLTAIDLREGTIRWQKVLGDDPKLAGSGLPPTGAENFGGTIATAGGLVFIGATKDEKFRAFSSADGTVLWETKLPAGGYATPCTYAVDGRQYVVIAAGGAGKLRTPAGDAFVAFALPSGDN